MTPSFAEATAAARRIAEWPVSHAGHPLADDARLLAAFVLAGDTERRLRAALERIAAPDHRPALPSPEWVRYAQQIARDALAEGGV